MFTVYIKLSLTVVVVNWKVYETFTNILTFLQKRLILIQNNMSKSRF